MPTEFHDRNEAWRRRARDSCRRTALVGLTCLALGACSLLPVSLPGSPAKPAQPDPKRQSAVEGPLDFGRLSTEAIDDPSAVAEAQTLLVDLGYKAGSIDGLMGPKTRRSIMRFQGDAGVARDGRVSEALLARLRAQREGRWSRPGTEKDHLPAYRVGTRFVYSDGRVFTIESADGDFLLWRSNRGEEISSYRNFILPPLAWSDDLGRGMRSFELSPSALWPLRPGAKVGFSARHLVNNAREPDERVMVVEEWRCEIGEATEVTVVAGRFDTLEIACSRQSDDGSPDLRRVWYYAPVVGHYVRVNDIYDADEQDRHVELVAIQPPRDEWPPAAQAGLDWALQHVLESGEPGRRFPWRSSAVDTQVTIAALKTYERGDGRNCRNFMQTWTTAGSRKNYPGTACRAGSGTWVIPGLEGSLDPVVR